MDLQTLADARNALRELIQRPGDDEQARLAQTAALVSIADTLSILTANLTIGPGARYEMLYSKLDEIKETLENR
jgi:hypothetical protein